jgi:hypothetical protein
MDDRREVFVAVASVGNPNIPRVEKIEFTDRTTVVEQYIDGVPLTEYLLTERLSKKEAIAIAEWLLTTLVQLGQKSIVHRDIKPDNILIDTTGRLFLIDFGISRIYRPGAASDTSFFGTGGYAAPEQYGYSQTDPRADLFSAGVVIKELCLASGHMEKSPILKFAVRCSKFDPDDRFRDAAEALRALRGVRRRPFFALAALLSAVLLAGLVLALALKSENTIPRLDLHPIVTPEPEQGLIVYDGADQRGSIALEENGKPIRIECAVHDGFLKLKLSDDSAAPAEFSFFNDSPPDALDYENSYIYGEIMFYDLDQDGRMEIFAALVDRAHNTGYVNWAVLWCIGHTKGEGFWLAGEIRTATGRDTFKFDFGVLGPDVIFLSDSMQSYVLDGRKLVLRGSY